MWTARYLASLRKGYLREYCIQLSLLEYGKNLQNLQPMIRSCSCIYEPWNSAKVDESLMLSLLMKDLESGCAFVLEGNEEEEEARRHWGKHMGAGKLGIFHASGKKKPRIIGDGSISGANPSCRIREWVRLPGLHSAQLFFDVCQRAQVGGSFFQCQRVVLRGQERGFSCFVLGG